MQLRRGCDRWGLRSAEHRAPDACWVRRVIFLPPSLVGNDWIILQMNHSIYLAHKHFLLVLIKGIKTEPSEGISKTTRLC